jgi:hypothetical protein
MRTRTHRRMCKAWNAINWHFAYIDQLEFLLVIETWSVRYFQNMMYSWCGAFWKLTRGNIAVAVQQIKGKRVIDRKGFLHIFILLLHPKDEIGICIILLFMQWTRLTLNIIILYYNWSVAVVDGYCSLCMRINACTKETLFQQLYTIETMKWLKLPLIPFYTHFD